MFEVAVAVLAADEGGAVPLADYLLGAGGHIVQRQADAAAIQFQQALQRQPAHTDARLNLGLALILSGQASEAVKHLQITVGDHPDSAKAHFNLGRAYLLDGQLAAGIQELNRSLRLRPTPAGHLEMGRALASAGDVPAAHSHFQQAIHLQTNFVPAYQAAAALHLQQGEIGKALELLSRAARLAPQDAGVHFQLGETLLLAGQTAQARAAFERVLALEPDHAATRARLRSIR